MHEQCLGNETSQVHGIYEGNDRMLVVGGREGNGCTRVHATK